MSRVERESLSEEPRFTIKVGHLVFVSAVTVFFLSGDAVKLCQEVFVMTSFSKVII